MVRNTLSKKQQSHHKQERMLIMKRSISLFLAMSLMFSLFAIANGRSLNEEDSLILAVEYYPDGSYSITRLISETASRATITKSKVFDFYSASSVLLWQVKLTATFTYNGSTASCTNATPSYTVYNTAWKVKKATASYSGNTATGSFTVKRYNLGIPVETINKTLTLTCSPSGVVT